MREKQKSNVFGISAQLAEGGDIQFLLTFCKSLWFYLFVNRGDEGITGAPAVQWHPRVFRKLFSFEADQMDFSRARASH